MTAADLAHSLGARQTGPGRWQARCPAHDDHSPSLSIAEGDGGRVLLHCWAGCDTSAVLAALGLAWRDIGGASATPAHRAETRLERVRQQVADAAERKRRDSLATAAEGLATRAGRLAARLAALEWTGAAHAYAGEAEALTADYHAALGAWCELEAA